MAVPTYLVQLANGSGGFHDLSSYTRSVSITRGRSRELDSFESGGFEIELDNRTRAFDPLYASSPFYGSTVPRREIRISANGYRIYTGFVNAWTLSYDVSGESLASVSGNDALLYFSKQVLPAGTPSSQLSGARISYVYTQPDVGWPSGVSAVVNAGQITLQADTIAANTNVLDYLRLIERTERGYLFISRNNELKFYNKTSVGTPGATISSLVFSDDGDIAYQNISVVYGTEMFYNSVTLERVGGTASVTADEPDSITTYGLSSYEDSGLLYNTQQDMIDTANMMSSKYGYPEYRINSITVMMNPLSGTQQNNIAQLDLVDIVQVQFTPNGVGSQISKYLRIIGIDHEMNVDAHYVTFKFAEVDNEYFILDSDVFGRLDYNLLGF
jgi:hypothetical protein